MATPRTHRRLIRRETHSSRAGLSVATAGLLLAAFLWLAVESVLALLGQDALLASPGRLATAAAAAPHSTQPAELAGTAAAAAVVGATLLVAALKGGRKRRRAMQGERAAVVVDDHVLAASVSRRVQLAGNLAPEQVTTTLGRTRAEVLVRPTSGTALDRDALNNAAAAEIETCRLVRKLTADVRIAAEGALGR